MKHLPPLLCIIFTSFLLVPQQGRGQGQEQGPDLGQKYGQEPDPVQVQAQDTHTRSYTKRAERTCDLEKFLFGENDTDMEFFSSSNAPFGATTQGFSISKKGPHGSYILEAKRIPNQAEVDKDLNKKMQDKLKVSDRDLPANNEGRERFSVILKKSLNEIKREQLKRYRIETKSVTISDSLAQKLRDAISAAADTQIYQGSPKGCFGYPPVVTFRCLKGNEEHSLTVESPQGEIRRMAEIFLIIIKDIFAGEFDESDCLKTLENYKTGQSPLPESGIQKSVTLDSLLMLRDKPSLLND